MIPDKVFKSLLHNYEDYEMYLKGQSIELGYRPDYVLKKGSDFIILESENCSSRKTFVGGLIKAAHYLQGEKTGILIFVIVPKENTTVLQIANHLRAYYSWIKEKTNLRKVYVIDACHYYVNQAVLTIDSDDFKNKSISI